jgi:hypothetical protein
MDGRVSGRAAAAIVVPGSIVPGCVIAFLLPSGPTSVVAGIR